MSKVFTVVKKETQWYIVYSETGKIVAKFSKESTAESFSKYLEDKKIYTLGAWQKQPWKVRLEFCCSTTAYFPNLNQA